jgi:hypothetical protein
MIAVAESSNFITKMRGAPRTSREFMDSEYSVLTHILVIDETDMEVSRYEYVTLASIVKGACRNGIIT